jgi:recombinational DNA repair protein (RecF pathway)
MLAACAEVAAIISAAATREKIPHLFMVFNFNLMSRIADEQSSRQFF